MGTTCDTTEGTRLEFRILGSIQVCRDGVAVPLEGAKPKTVIAALLLADGYIVADAALKDLLWGPNPPATAHAQLYTYVSRLRRALGRDAEILRRPPGYVLCADSLRFDLAEFEALARQGRAALDACRYEEAATLLRDALSHWHGPALADASPHLIDAEGHHLEEARTAVVESRIEADLALGRHNGVLSELIGLVRKYPLRERFRAQLMTTLYRCDRQADALVLYDEGRRLLADELGVYPGTLLREVHRAILAEDPRLRLPGFAVSL